MFSKLLIGFIYSVGKKENLVSGLNRYVKLKRLFSNFFNLKLYKGFLKTWILDLLGNREDLRVLGVFFWDIFKTLQFFIF
jgi:hypothetical protein